MRVTSLLASASLAFLLMAMTGTSSPTAIPCGCNVTFNTFPCLVGNNCCGTANNTQGDLTEAISCSPGATCTMSGTVTWVPAVNCWNGVAFGPWSNTLSNSRDSCSGPTIVFTNCTATTSQANSHSCQMSCQSGTGSGHVFYGTIVNGQTSVNIFECAKRYHCSNTH